MRPKSVAISHPLGVTPAQAKALDLAKHKSATAEQISRVASATSPEAAQWAFEQWELRRRAAAKFGLAEEMLFDRDGLEMATHERVAAYHASLFPNGEFVADLTVGVGSDLIAFARRGPAEGFELDATRAEYAIHNLQVHSVRAEIHAGDALSQMSQAKHVFCDPARRAGGARTLDIAAFSPDPKLVLERWPSAVLKLSPMLSDHVLESFGGRLECLSFAGECREALVLTGKPHSRAAVHIESGAVLAASQDSDSSASQPDSFIFEADPAAIRAHCLPGLCRSFALRKLADSNGYLTGPERVRSPWLKGYEVLATSSADIKQTKAELKRLNGGTPIVKARAQNVNVEALRHELRGKGHELVLIVYPLGRSLRHAICRVAD